MDSVKASITIENMEGISTSLYKSSEKGTLLKEISNSASKAKEELDNGVSNAAKRMLQKAGLEKEIPKPQVNLSKGQNPKMIYVQYNPTSLKLNSSIEQKKTNTLSADLQEIYKRIGGLCSIELNVSLIFSSQFPSDTFVNEKVEQFLAFLMTSNDRIVTFAWGNNFFRGVMTSMNAKYSQFDRVGNPTFATVDISIYGSTDMKDKKIDSLEKQRNTKLIPQEGF